MKGKIGIDISQVVHEGTGVATYTRELVKALLRFDPDHEYVLFGISLRKKSVLDHFAAELSKDAPRTRFRTCFYPLPPSLAEPLFDQFPRPKIELFTGKLNAFHTSDWIEPPSNCSKVAVVHDLAMFKFPEFAQERILKVHRRKLKLARKEANKVIAVSNSTKNDLVEMLGFDPAKITVIYEAAGDQFKPAHKRSLLQKYGIGGKYVLTLGTREPRKNLRRTIEAFSKLGLKNTRLVVVGKFGWGEDIRPSENVIVTGFIPGNDLPTIYTFSEAFVYPALYEGFGLPVLEAMSCGAPVVTSNTSSLPEVAGKAAVMVDPTNIGQIAAGIRTALENRDILQKKGIEQAKKFSWERTAHKTVEVYEKIMSSAQINRDY